jgi:fructose/tagatose bisphosphate aldolase
MPLVSMRQLLDHAAENGYGLPAFNVNNLEQVQAIMEAADETGSPVIMQASAGARKYAGEALPAPPDRGRASRPTRTSRSSCTRTTASRRRSAWAPSAPASPAS